MLRLFFICAMGLGLAGIGRAADAPSNSADLDRTLDLAASFSGEVLLDDGATIPAGMEVLLKDGEGVVAARTSTDEEGRFSLSADPGAYRLVIAQRLSTPVRLVRDGELTRVRVILPSEGGTGLDGAADDTDWTRIGVLAVIVAVPLTIAILASSDVFRSDNVSP